VIRKLNLSLNPKNLKFLTVFSISNFNDFSEFKKGTEEISNFSFNGFYYHHQSYDRKQNTDAYKEIEAKRVISFYMSCQSIRTQCSSHLKKSICENNEGNNSILYLP